MVHDLGYQFIRSWLSVHWKLFLQKWLPSLIATMPEVIAFMQKASSIPTRLLLILAGPMSLLKR